MLDDSSLWTQLQMWIALWQAKPVILTIIGGCGAFFSLSVPAALVLLAADINEQSTVPLFVSIICAVSIGGFGIAIGRQTQKLIDRMDILEEQFKDLRQERTRDTLDLRAQLRSASLLDHSAGSTFKILIIQDDQNDRDLVNRRLSHDFETDAVQTMEEGLQLLSETLYDCVLLDLKLPDIRPDHTMQEFRRNCPNVLCIVLSGLILPDQRDALLAQGADAVWVKGIDDANVKVFGRKIREAIWRGGFPGRP